jgi:hypothetical protein
LYVTSAAVHDNNYLVNDVDKLARNSFDAFEGRPEIATMFTDRVRLRCPQEDCDYDGVKTQTELVKMLMLARFVYNTPEIQLED